MIADWRNASDGERAKVVVLPTVQTCPACGGPVRAVGAAAAGCPSAGCSVLSVGTQCVCGAQARMPVGVAAPAGWVRLTAGTEQSVVACSDRCVTAAAAAFVTIGALAAAAGPEPGR
jgi:hypothetical protein